MDFINSCIILPLQEEQGKKHNNETPTTKSPEISTSTVYSSSLEKAVLDISDLKRVFDKFDMDGDGKISSKELEAAMRRLGQPPASDEELQVMMEEMDSDRDGLVDANEFLDYYASILDDASSDDAVVELEQAFSVFDLDGDGRISAEELQMTLINSGEEATMKQCQGMIEAFDCDGDGCISFSDFLMMMCTAADVRSPVLR